MLAACGTTSTPGPASTPDYTGKTLRLGAVISLTGAGSGLAVQQKNGIELAVDELNAKGGVNGARVAIDIKDDASQQQQGADAFTALVKAGAYGLVGPTLANTALAAHPVANKLRTPVIAASLTGSGVVGQCPYPCDYVFRDSLGEGQAIPDNVKTAAGKYHPGRAVLFYANDDKSSSDTGALFQQAFADNGINVPTGAVNAFPKVTSDFKDAVTAALATRPDIWAIAAVGAIPAQVMTEARSQGYKGPFLGNNAFNSYGLAAQAGKAGTGAQAASGYFTGADNMANTAFVAAYKARFKDPDGKPLVPDEVAAQAYTSVRLFAAAAARAALTFSDPAADRRRLRDALAVTSIDSPLGAFSFTAQHDARQPVYILAMDGKGGYTLVETLPVQ